MAHEVTRKWSNSSVVGVNTAQVTDRPPASDEMRKHFGEGGATNAGLDALEACTRIGAVLGRAGLAYGTDFYLKWASSAEITVEIRTDALCDKAMKALLDEGISVAVSV